MSGGDAGFDHATRAAIYGQATYNVRCEWGPEAVALLAPHADVVVIVDVLSFSTCVSVAVERGAVVLPYGYRDESAAAFATAQNAVLAGPRDGDGLSLSPVSLQRGVHPGMRLVLPSPNGSTLSRATSDTPTLAGCLRNATAVAEAARRIGSRIAVIPAGERWHADQTLRPAIEDWLGAGAILAALAASGTPAADFSPEARLAAAAFAAVRDTLPETIRNCASGRELVARGFASDVELALALDVTPVVPRLTDGAFTAQH